MDTESLAQKLVSWIREKVLDAGRKGVALGMSGGLDSATCVAIAKNEGFEIYGISFRYGQRHNCELVAAERVVAAVGAREHIVVDIDLKQFGGSALIGDMAVPKGRSVEDMGDDIPVTYVPARNTVFLSLALAWSETLDAGDIFIGVNACG